MAGCGPGSAVRTDPRGCVPRGHGGAHPGSGCSDRPCHGAHGRAVAGTLVRPADLDAAASPANAAACTPPTGRLRRCRPATGLGPLRLPPSLSLACVRRLCHCLPQRRGTVRLSASAPGPPRHDRKRRYNGSPTRSAPRISTPTRTRPRPRSAKHMRKPVPAHRGGELAAQLGEVSAIQWVPIHEVATLSTPPELPALVADAARWAKERW
jgi:hypothetical protein